MDKENVVVESMLVRDFENKSIDLVQEYQGKPLLAIIYNNQCLGCTGRAIPLAYELQKENEGIQVVGIHTKSFVLRARATSIDYTSTIEI